MVEASAFENGMTDALFAIYPLTGGEEGTEIAFEIYRFKTVRAQKFSFRTCMVRTAQTGMAHTLCCMSMG